MDDKTKTETADIVNVLVQRILLVAAGKLIEAGEFKASNILMELDPKTI